MKKILELGIRKKIFELIKKNPGINATKLAELINVKSQLVDYHLYYMENHKLINTDRRKGYTLCYAKGKIGTEDKKNLSLMRQEFPLKIVMFLLKNPYSRHREIHRTLQISSSRFSYHLKKLVKAGIIKLSESGNKTGYIVINDIEITDIIIRYKPYSILKMAKDTWVDFQRR